MLDFKILKEKAEKIVKYRTPQGREVCLTREVYLRDDISCKSWACTSLICRKDGLMLPANLEFYVIVDGSYALSYWEVFELEDISGVIITLSTANYVQQQASSQRPYKNLRKSLEDPVQTCVLFDNEFHTKCFRPPGFNENALDYTSRMNWISAQWYAEHLRGSISVILVTENKRVIDECASRSVNPSNDCGVIVLDLQELLETYYPENTAAKLLFESLQASLRTKLAIPSSSLTLDDKNEASDKARNVSESNFLPVEPKPGDVYPDYLPESALVAGMRAGQFLRGTLRVSRFRAQTEAMVALSDASSVKHQVELRDALSSRSEIAINGIKHRNRAMEGDLVVVRLLPRAQWTPVSSNVSAAEDTSAEVVETTAMNLSEGRTDERRSITSADSNLLPCGFIVGIVNRRWRDYVCAYIPSGENSTTDPVPETGWILVTPWDRRIPRIRMHTTQALKLSRERFVVRIDSWNASSNYPSGHFVQALGPIGDLETETQTLLIEHNLAVRGYTDAQLKELAPFSVQRPWIVDPGEVKQRRDLRSPQISGNPKSEDVLVFSIDPQGCQDVDDTLSVKWLSPIYCDEDNTEHRRIQLGVHIADVTYFVPHGTFVDAEARKRSTSIYLADRRYDMLPGLLSSDLCSLWSGVDRYAVSVIWEIDLDAFDVLDVWYGRSVIRSKYKLTYEAAQYLHDRGPAPETYSAETETLFKHFGGRAKVEELVPELRSLNPNQAWSDLCELQSSIQLLVQLASTIREKREARGGLQLDSTEISVRFENPALRSGKLLDLVPKESLEMHGTVAELMIFANHWVARRCLEAYPDRSCLRRHPPPRPEFFDDLLRCASSKGFNLDTSSNLALGKSLALIDDEADPEIKKVLLQLTTRAMTNALYFSTGADSLTRDQFAHYGLALNLYTHFTSPIRRYADVIVHRILLTALGDFRSSSKSSTDCDRLGAESCLFTSEELSSICQHMNEQHWAAQQVQRASVQLFQALFFRDRKPDDPMCLADAVICQLRGNNGFEVLISRFGVRGSVCVKRNQTHEVAWVERDQSDTDGDGVIRWLSSTEGLEVNRVYNTGPGDCGHLEVRNVLTGCTQAYHMFDHVTVKIHVSESTAHGLGLRLELMSGPKSKQSMVTESVGNKEQISAALVESVQELDAKRKQTQCQNNKQQAQQTAAQGKVESTLNQDQLICKLHDPSSLYHLFRSRLRQEEV